MSGREAVRIGMKKRISIHAKVVLRGDFKWLYTLLASE